ncbi:MAG: UDP-3-O-(3-hydroxymyristoyl)glucosamine N-acyltransferase [Candidatus Tectomicrobia bacterium]|uniref:UDP-3-O-acylglucosamine N-acyltransferase n=1 Tax=Tectimicrobiota bacterium TaxID=2528274 RepID=A0A932GRP2_UNCTE|nr:UDP-3-O-(3-hydroxymyristoyl)glucosamine N-acyltransferase [Candidatus Tectomicrobia bacterium]
MKATLAQLAALVGGTVQGDPELELSGVAALEDARAGEITFVARKKYLPLLSRSAASAVIIEPGLSVDRPALVVSNAYLAFSKILAHFHPPAAPRTGVDPRAFVEEGVVLEGEVSIYPFAWVGKGARLGAGVILHAGVAVGEGVTIGRDTVIHCNVSIYPGVTIGQRVIIHSGAVLGSDGFGFVPAEGGRHQKIPQVGGVVIEDDVEIGANVCIDRATLGVTRVGRGTKIDNLVQIAHNVKVGEDSIIVALAGISGSVTIGKGVTIAGQAGLGDHITVGDGSTIAGQSGVAKDVEPGSVLTGTPAIPHVLWRRVQACVPQLPEMVRKLQNLDKRLRQLEQQKEKD